MRAMSLFVAAIVITAILVFAMAYPLLTVETSNINDDIAVNVAYAYLGEPRFSP